MNPSGNGPADALSSGAQQPRESAGSLEDPRVARALEAYRADLEAGGKPDRARFLAAHPEIASVLADCLDGLEFVHAAAPALSQADGVPTVGAADLLSATPLGDFCIVREVGRGGMGVVYEAEQLSLGRRVALKVLPFAAALDAKQLQRFKNEAQAAAHLQHPHIVPVHYVGCERGVHFYAMQFIDGQTLAALIAELRHLVPPPMPETREAGSAVSALAEELASGRWAPAAASPSAGSVAGQPSGLAITPPVAVLSTERSATSPAFFRTVASLGVQAAEALDHAHQLGVIHRDIKPANLLVDATGQLWVTDFGLARLGTEAGLTMSGDLLGTLRYMSPEQTLGQRAAVDARTDVYSLGITLYELLTLEPAYDGRSREEVLRQIAFEEPPPPRWLNPAIPAELETIVLKAMAKSPDERYATAQELADDLRRYLEDKPIHARRPTLRQRAAKWARRHTTVVRAAGVVLALGMVGLAVSTALIWQAKDRLEQANADLRQSLERERREAYYQRIGRAEREWSANNLGGMEQHLDACPEDLRGWEWHYLKGLRREGLAPMRHDAPVFGAVFSPDGERLASASQDGAIKVWEARTGRELHCFRAHEQHIRRLAFHPGGKLLASVSWDGTVKVWDVRTDRPALAWEGQHIGRVNGVAFSPDGRYLASSSGRNQEMGELKVRDAATGTEIWSRQAPDLRIRCLAFHPDGQHLATARVGVGVTVWHVPTRREQVTLAGPGNSVDMSFSPDGRLLAHVQNEGRGNGKVRIWDWQTGLERPPLPGHFRPIWCLAFSPDGRRLVTGSADHTIKVWDVTTGQEALTLRGHSGNVWSVGFSLDGHRLVSAGTDQTLRVWDARPWHEGETSQEFRTLRGHRQSVESVAFHPQGTLLASGSLDGTLKLWDIRTGRELQTLPSVQGDVSTVAFSPDGQWLATAGSDRTIKTWSLDARPGAGGIQPVRSLAGHTDGILSLAYSPDSQRLASAGFDRTVRIWDVATAEEMKQLHGHTWAIINIAFSPDGRYLASASNDTTVRLWDVAAGAEVTCLEPQKLGEVYGVAFSPDGKLLAAGSWDRTVRLWRRGEDGRTWRLVHVLRDPTGGVECVAFRPGNEPRLAWGSLDGTVKVWDQRTGQTQVLRGHTNWVRSVAFSPDGKVIASASLDGTVKLWQVPPVRE